LPEAGPGKRAATYWFLDGLPEMVFGLAFVLLGGAGILLPFRYPSLRKPVVLILFVAFIVLWTWDRKILRTGYVQPPGDPYAEPEGEIIRIAVVRRDENITWFR
jgi:hypothetical protein